MADLTAGQIAGMRATHEMFLSGLATRRRFTLVTDQYGDKIRGATTDVANIPVEIWQESNREDRDDRDQQERKSIARLPHGTDVTGKDQLIVGGLVFEVDGPPADKLTHLLADVYRIEG